MPKPGARVVVAMSGGVDSSVAAGLLKEQGFEVIGISLQLHDMSEPTDNKFGSCCSLGDLSDARRVAERLQIPFYVANMEEEFHSAVVDDFIHEYLIGRTPNPCVRCNEKVKFRRLMDWALDLGADFLATGHYAHSRYNEANNRFELCKSEDAAKDQSYFLFTLKQEDLARTIFPIGGLQKSAVRDLARKYGLAVADKPDSQEICFVTAKSYKEFIEREVPASQLVPGAIVNTEGKEIGRHTGLHQFTIGQRKGLGVNSLDPLFVLALRSDTNEVVVGPETGLFRKKCTVSHANWVNGDVPESERQFHAKIRHRAKESPVVVRAVDEKNLEVSFLEPQRVVTPGQAIVFYEGERVVGGGWIDDLAISV